MKKLTNIFAVMVVLGASVMPAMAATGYAALDAGQTKATDICQGGLPGCANTATMYRVAAGGQFSDMLGVEFSYADYGKASLGSIGPASADWKLTGFELAGIGTFPFGDVFALTAKLGVAQTNLKVTAPNFSQSANSNTLAWGLGALFNINKGFAVRAQYEELGKVGDAATTGKTKVTLMTAGILVRF